jgi:hypothetical protein
MWPTTLCPIGVKGSRGLRQGDVADGGHTLPDELKDPMGEIMLDALVERRLAVKRFQAAVGSRRAASSRQPRLASARSKSAACGRRR